MIELEKNGGEKNELMREIVSNGWGSFKNSWQLKEKTSGKKENNLESIVTNR